MYYEEEGLDVDVYKDGTIRLERDNGTLIDYQTTEFWLNKGDLELIIQAQQEFEKCH